MSVSTVAHATATERRRAPVMKRPKALSAAQCEVLEQLPNIGPSLAQNLRSIGIQHPRELAHRDPLALYLALCRHAGKRQDPCVLDTFMAATDFMRGASAAPWWAYTARRKAIYGQVQASAAPQGLGAGISAGISDPAVRQPL
jgi:Pathogenicity locus